MMAGRMWMISMLLGSCGAAAAGQPNRAQAEEVIQTESGPVVVERLASLVEPWGMALLPDERLLITEKPGRLRLFADGRLSEPFRGVPEVEYRGQGGLLDVAIDPDFERNGLVYLSYAERAERQPPDARETGDPRFANFLDLQDNVLKGAAVARGRLADGALLDVQVIWRQEPKTIGRGHFGGRLVFSSDGKLFITSGDRQRFEVAQDPESNVGKMVRINPDGSIPDDNPFVNAPGTLPDIWSLGHRNPLGAVIHPDTKELWIHEMGPLHGDEVNLPEPGKNYGWPVVSNGDHYDGSPIPDHSTEPRFAAPIHTWVPSVSPSGLIFHDGTGFAAWRGKAFLGGLSSKALIRLTIEGNRVRGEERFEMERRIRDVLQAPDGSLLVLTDAKDGELLRLTPRAQTDASLSWADRVQVRTGADE